MSRGTSSLTIRGREDQNGKTIPRTTTNTTTERGSNTAKYNKYTDTAATAQRSLASPPPPPSHQIFFPSSLHLSFPGFCYSALAGFGLLFPSNLRADLLNSQCVLPIFPFHPETPPEQPEPVPFPTLLPYSLTTPLFNPPPPLCPSLRFLQTYIVFLLPLTHCKDGRDSTQARHRGRWCLR